MDKATHQIAADPANDAGPAQTAPIASAPLRSRFAHDPDMGDLVALFAKEMPARVAALEACWDSRDLNRLIRMSHQLKGAGSGYGFPELSAAAGMLEATLRAILDEGESPGTPRLRKEYTTLVSLLRSVRGD